jgi:hypothetical protein
MICGGSSIALLLKITLSSHPGWLGLPPKAAPAKGRPNGADAPMHQSREAHHPARPHHSPRGQLRGSPSVMVAGAGTPVDEAG